MGTKYTSASDYYNEVRDMPCRISDSSIQEPEDLINEFLDEDDSGEALQERHDEKKIADELVKALEDIGRS
jgi:hypothetical protein